LVAIRAGGVVGLGGGVGAGQARADDLEAIEQSVRIRTD
jgi:hypothetical protein